ncbi:MAG: helix-turn-helix domain-containing protein [Sarcina sp.]
MNTRLRYLRKSLNLTQKEFANSLLLSRTTVASFESGAKIPSDKTIDHICAKYNLNKNWLLTNSGDMYDSTINNLDFFNDIIESLDEDDTDSLLFIKSYIKLPSKDKNLINDLLTRLSK